MFDPERIHRLAAKLGNRNDALEFVRQMRCGGKKYDGGGKFFRTNLQNESPLMYQPMIPSAPNVLTPLRYEPEPHYGLYEYPSSTGLAENYPIAVPSRKPTQWSDVLVQTPMVVQAPVEEAVSDLFSDEAIARRKMKQRYAESRFNDKAVSEVGARGAWQIMPITLKDYLGRGRGKAGDLNDPEYNEQIRDWVMKIIPRDLQEFWSEDDSDRNKLAKLYAAYNWGAGNLRGFLRKKQKAGIDISNPDNWVDDLNPETRRYVKYLAFDEDIPDSTVYTNAAFEKAAAERGYAEGGKLFEMGGPSGPINPNVLRQAVKQTLLRAIPRNILVGTADLADNVAGIPSFRQIKEIPEAGKFYTDALDNGESGYYEDGYIENPGLTFLLDRGRQSEMLQKMGYHPVNDGYYGSVTSATRKLNALKGDVIPIFQRGDDEVDFSEVEPVADKDGNYFFERTSYLGDIFGENELNHASYHPVSFYKHKGTGDIYVRGYDLNDYGKHDKNMWRNLPEAIGNSLFNQGYSYNKAGQTYGDEQYLAEIYDYIGNPFVQRTALVKAPEELVKKYFGDNYASGGKIHIKPENRGKFNALLKRTGKSASWFKEHGTPLQRKRATFALSARKWRHDEGGEIEREPDNFAVRDNTYVNSLIPGNIGFNPAEERPLSPSLGQARWDDGVTGAIPFIGDALQGVQAIRDFKSGDPVTGFQTAGLLLIPNIAEKAVRGIFKKAATPSALDNTVPGPPSTLLEKIQKLREKGDAIRALSGDIPDPARTVLSLEELGVEKNIPQEIKDRLYYSSMERMRRQRPEMDVKELGQKFGDVTNRTYREYPRSTFDKAGVNPDVTGRHYDNGHIAIPDDAGDDMTKSIAHELRHELDWQVPLTENEKSVLSGAYGDDFDNTGRGGKSPKQLNQEEVTTNFDARTKLLGDKIALPVDEQNALIDAATPEQIGMAVYQANGYGSSFMKKLVDEKKWTTARANKIKEAMKTVGAVSGAAAVSRALYNDEDLPVQLADGGELYRGDTFLYNPQNDIAEETPVPYSVEGYKEQQFYDNPANRITYLVQPGDTSWGISSRSGVPLGTLLKMNPDIGTGERIYPGQQLAVGYKEYVPDTPKQKVETSDDSMYYSVQKGDYLGKIAKDNGMSLDSLLKLNPQFVGRENQINIGEKVNIGIPSVGKNRQFKTMKERREWEAGLDNVGAIQNYKHEKNYAIVDKNAQTLTVYSPDNRIVQRFHVNTGSSNEDYNTKTYEDEKGHILYGQGNMSTPAGITEIVSVGNDYGHNSFVRARVGNDGKVRKVKDSEGNLVNDTIASSIHYEKGLYGPNASNGCIRMSGKDVDALKDYLGVGSRVYTLPQSKDDDGNAKSWFKLEDGKLSFYASDPVGETDNTGFEPQPVYENGRIKKDKDGNIVYRDFAAEDDYNQTVDMTASPLYSSYRVDNAASEYERNRAIFATTLADNKQAFMKELIDNKIGVNSDTYNKLAELAMAIANQESEFGTGTTFIAKSSFPDVVRKIKGEDGAMSVGATQMKYAGYNDDVKKILENMGVNTSQDTRSQWNIANSAKATLALLAYFYNEQLTPSHRRKLRSHGMTEEEALAMMFNGKSVKWLEDFTSDPDWRSKTHIVPSLPGGLLKKHFNKESLVADYANKAVNYMTDNESFYRRSGGLIEKYSPDKLKLAIQSIRARQKK